MVNKVTLIGNLGKDPEIRRLETGAAVGKFSIATNESYRDKSGEWQTQTEWHDVVVWNAMAERAERDLKKGKLVYVEGKLTHRKYTDKNDIERYITEVRALTYRLLEKRESAGGAYGNSLPTAADAPPVTTAQSTATAPANATPVSTAAPAAPTTEPAAGDDDLPF